MAVFVKKKNMTPSHSDSPLRRSEVATCSQNIVNVTINDDDAERREARRRTIQRSSGVDTTESSALEDNETLKKCLEIYQGNKLSRENAWSLSLIDTLFTLLDRHHKSLRNFKVAGSSLEASSKVYSLRVDSIHTDVLRMMAGLNAQKFNERQLENDDDDDDNDTVATGGEGSNDPVAGAAAPEQVTVDKNLKKAKPRRQRCTVTKNKETLNARLDTVPLQDPVFGKLNSTVGSINSSNRLMNNILLTTNSELKLRTTFLFWNNNTLPDCDYTEEFLFNDDNETEWAACDRLLKITKNSENLKLRPLHGAYTITDTPAPSHDDKEQNPSMDYDDGCNVDNYGERGGGDADIVMAESPCANVHEMSMAFDMNADCEPVPVVSEQTHSLDVDYAELDDLTTEERIAINNCRGLRRAPVIIEDLRPVDASSNLEYSYRPMDKISQFWAGPSHWKFKRTRTRLSSFAATQQNSEVNRGLGITNNRVRRNRQTAHKRKSKQLTFGEFHDDCFIKLYQYKNRRANIQKKWDQKKLKLPVDMQLSPDLFQHITLAPGIAIHQIRPSTSDALEGESERQDDSMHANVAESSVDPPQQDHFMDNNIESVNDFNEDIDMCGESNPNVNVPSSEVAQADNNMADSTVLEIATNFEGAPTQVTKIVVPFARRAKVIDMKSLKRNCSILLNKQLQRPLTQQPGAIPQHPIKKDEQYKEGVATFHELYKDLPQLLTQNMNEALSPSIAFYSILHLANEFDLRLIPQEDLLDFTIRKLGG